MDKAITIVYQITLKNNKAKKVDIASDLNGWIAQHMHKDENGIWYHTTKPLTKMPYTPVNIRYKFIIDEKYWTTDPENVREIAGDSFFTIEPINPIKNHISGTIKQFTIFSKILNSKKTFHIYFPPKYDEHSNNRYPAVYWLHGYHDGGELDFIEKGNIHTISNILISNSIIKPMIHVFPDGEDSFYINKFDGTRCFEDFFIKEFIPNIDCQFKTISNYKSRGIGGISMGGYGAMKLRLQYPNVFSSTTSHSGLYDVRDLAFLPHLYGSGIESIEHRKKNSPILLAKHLTSNQNNNLYFDCGLSDHLLGSAISFSKELQNLNIEHVFTTEPGYHAWDFVQRRLPHSLKWHSDKLESSF